MTGKYTDKMVAEKLDMDYHKFRKVIYNNPSAPVPEKVGRDRWWTDPEYALIEAWVDKYENTPMSKFRCAQCGRFAANIRELFMVGDCSVDGVEVPVVRSEELRQPLRRTRAAS